MELHGQWFSDLHINRKVVSDICDPTNPYIDFFPPNKTTTLKSGPQPKITAECPHRPVMAVGRATCRMVEKQTLHRGNWKIKHIHDIVHYSNILEYNYYRDGTYMYIHTCTFVHHNHRSFLTGIYTSAVPCKVSHTTNIPPVHAPNHPSPPTTS